MEQLALPVAVDAPIAAHGILKEVCLRHHITAEIQDGIVMRHEVRNTRIVLGKAQEVGFKLAVVLRKSLFEFLFWNHFK